MVRETRHLWVGNLPDNIREDRVREHFKRYGRVQSIKLLPRGGKEETGEMACTVAFMDIKSASKAHTAEHKLDDRTLTTEYYEPAAIPSSSPPNVPTGYVTTSPSTTRFPNGHSSTEEHGNFTDRFYERTNNSRVPLPEVDYIRRPPGYHDSNRGRNRDRGYRNNGPFTNNILEQRQQQQQLQQQQQQQPLPPQPQQIVQVQLQTPRVNSNLASWSPYEAPTQIVPTVTCNRFNNETNANAVALVNAGFNASAVETFSGVLVNNSVNIKKKSRSGSPSPTGGSTSSRSLSRSRSRSSSSSSSSSTSRETSSSTGSPKSRRLQSVNASHQAVVHSEDRRPLTICVRNLPLRSSDTSLKDGLFHEYKKHGKVTWVKVVGQSSERHAIVCFKKPEDVEKALEVSYDKLFFGHKIEVAPYQGYDVEDNDLRPYEAEIDEFHPKATRTLFIGNLEKDVTASDLRKHFDQFGDIIEIDIKKQGAVSSYAFCQYSDIVSVVKAIRLMDGEHLNNNRIKLGFGKSMPTPCVWVDGVNDAVTDKYLSNQFDPFGIVGPTFLDREKGQALIFFDQVLNAQAAVNKMRGVTMRGRKLQVDFASRECQEAFFENLEKQGQVFERPGFDERRDSTTRSFENLNVTRFSRYETPTRPRTSSYSSRSGAPGAPGQCVTTAIPSPGTPGSATPRGAGSRSRLARFEYYEQNPTEYPDRHFRSYDEYSQGSPGSHEDTYDEYVYQSPSHLEPIDAKLIAEHVVVPFPPPDIRNLQKERVLLLEQLEECPSSGDELISPKKRLKLEHIDGTITSDVIIEANRDHRKVMEVRRLSDASLKHLSRRPSVDGGGKHLTHERGGSSSYMPHAVCKRRKTAGSDSGRLHHYESSESVGGSRPGTPLCDERPEHFQQPTEPRRVPREREGPLTLPLPRFASQHIGRLSISIAGIKGQKENVLSSPPPAVTSPRICNAKPPSPTPVPPPASPPPRPPSLSSNSSDSDGAPPSPSLDERIKSLDEKYEKWSGSRALSAAGSDALAKLDANRERFKCRLLDLDLKEVQPSEIVKSVMAKRSVFDEDTKRLENVGEKYEPKEFKVFNQRLAPVTIQTSSTSSVPAPPTPTSLIPIQSTLPLLKVCTNPLPKTPTMLSPRSTGTPLTPAKGLQYPFPTHPPMQPSPSAAPTTPTATPPPPQTSTTQSTTTAATVATATAVAVSSTGVATTTTTTTAATTTRSTHSENRLKLCANASSTSDNWTPSKVIVNRVVPNKTSDAKSNIPPLPLNCINSGGDASQSQLINKVIANQRRDSTTNNTNSDITTNKSRRNSETGARKPELESSEYCDNSGKEQDRLEKLRLEQETIEREAAERERVEKERLDKERQERERLEAERIEKERAEKERLEKERIAAKEKERLVKERSEKERRDKERLAKERADKERLAKERLEKERLEKERLEKERLDKERLEREKERFRIEKERKERERIEKEQADKEREEDKSINETVDKCDEERKYIKEENHSESKPRNKEQHHSNATNTNTTENKQQHNENHISESKSTKEAPNHVSNRVIVETSRNSGTHENRENKNRYNIERDVERRKESAKENRENNLHEKVKNLFNEIREGKDRPALETHHASFDLDKKYDLNLTNKGDPSRRKERNNSLPASIGSKRRISSQHEGLDGLDEAKKIKLNHEHRKVERRDSKDSRNEDNKSKSNSHKHKSDQKTTSSKTGEDKSNRIDKHNHVMSEEKRKEREREREERHKQKQIKTDKLKLKSKKDPLRESLTPKSPPKERDKESTRENKELLRETNNARDSKDLTRDVVSKDSIRAEKEQPRDKDVLLREKETLRDIKENQSRELLPSMRENRDKDSSSREKDASNREKDSTSREKDSTSRDKDSSNREKDTSNREKDSSSREKDASREKDSSSREKDSSSREKDASNREKDCSSREKDSSSREKDSTNREKDSSIREKDTTNREKESTSREKDATIREKDALARDKETSSRDTLREKEATSRDFKESSSMREYNSSREFKESIREFKESFKLSDNKDFLARLDLMEVEKQKQRRDKFKMLDSPEHHGDDGSKSGEDRRKESREEMAKSSDEPMSGERKIRRIRKMTNSSDNSESDEPKKHSIFDIVDDGPAYISMYDKVKARSCKNMQKQEEEKRQEKIKAKFSQLKQSRAKREEKKRSTSWDEDSDSDLDKSLHRKHKMLIESSDEEHMHRLHKDIKKEIFSDSDSDRIRQTKSEHAGSSDEDHIKHLQRKGSKSRITSDTSDDDFKKAQNLIKTEIFSDNEDQGFADSDEKKIKDEYQSEKYQLPPQRENTFAEMNTQMFGDISQSPPIAEEVKEDKFNNTSRRIYDNSSADESIERKEKSEIRKKHKKKQKRLKNSVSSEESSKFESMSESMQSDGSKNFEKRKQHSKKDKKRDKNNHEEKIRDKLKKSKSKHRTGENKDMRRDGKMENIFGSLSDDSEPPSHKDPQDTLEQQQIKPNFLERFSEENNTHYASDSDSLNQTEKESILINQEQDLDRVKAEERVKLEERNKIEERLKAEERIKIEERNFKANEKRLAEEKERFLKEEHRKRKEKKRRDKEKRLRDEQLNNDNSVDYVDLGKQLENNIKDDSNEVSGEVKIKNEIKESRPENTQEEAFRFSDVSEQPEPTKRESERKETKEKKKKRKKSKDEKQRHHHHHHHHDKNKIKSPEIIKKELIDAPLPIIEEIKIEDKASPSLPSIFDMPSPPLNKSSPNLDVSISPQHREPILISPIPKTPTSSKDKKRDKFIPAFGVDVDEKVHENAVKSIPEFEPSALPETPTKSIQKDDTLNPDLIKIEKIEAVEEKPRVVISQEETEDAVAALLGESFGSGQFEDCYNEPPSPVPEASVISEENVQDDEEMRQAVQSLNSSELEIKPDTPQSEHELQIDTDTEEQEEIALRYDQPPKTPDMIDLSQPPKTPDIPSYFRTKDDAKSSIILKTPNIGSPPSLTPIKQKVLPINVVVNDAKRNLEAAFKKTPTPEAPRSVIAKIGTWSGEDKDKIVNKVEKIVTTTYEATPIINKTVPSTFNSEIIKPANIPSVEVKPETQPPPLKPVKPLIHNMPAQISYPVPKQIDSPKITNINPMNRLPITSMMIPKPMHPTTIVLPQPKSVQPTPQINTNRMVYQPNQNYQPTYQQPRIVQAPIQRHPMPRQVIPTTSYANYIPPIVASNAYTTNQTSVIDKVPPKLVIPLNVKPTIIAHTTTTPSFVKSIVPVIQKANEVVTHPPIISSIIQTTKSVQIPVTQATQAIKELDVIKSEPPMLKEIIKIETSVEMQQPIVLEQPKLIEVKENANALIQRTSSPSPVIVAPIVKELPPLIEVPPLKPIQEFVAIPPISITPPLKHVAIEKVADELNLSLKKEEVDAAVAAKIEVDLKIELAAKLKEVVPEIIVSVIKEIEKFDDCEKAETESVLSDTSKDPISCGDIKDDQLDSKEDSDYWSAKEVNIDSVIKKVDALCSADELSDRSSEVGKDDWLLDDKLDVVKEPVSLDKALEDLNNSVKSDDSQELFDEVLESNVLEEVATKGRGRGRGRGSRGRGRGGVDRGGMTTRRGKIVKETVPTRGRGRGGRSKGDRKISKSESNDVYEFHDDSDENKDRPRLILTIKSPAITQANGNPTQTAILKEVSKEAVTTPPKIITSDKLEEFASPANTRKSRRLQERDTSKNTVDDTIEDVVKNTVHTRSSAAAAASGVRRSARQTIPKTLSETNRKSPRGGKAKKDRRASETTDDSGEEKILKNEAIMALIPNKVDTTPPPTVTIAATTTEIKEIPQAAIEAPKEIPIIAQPVIITPPIVETKEKPHEGLKAAMLRRVKGEMNQEPMTLIDPVTGLLTPMRECEEGRYIPVSGAPGSVIPKGAIVQMQGGQLKIVTNVTKSLQDGVKPTAIISPNQSQVQLIQQAQPQAVIKQATKLHPLKAHVLKGAQMQPIVLNASTVVTTPTFTSKVATTSQLNVNVAFTTSTTHVSPRATKPKALVVTQPPMQAVKVIQPTLPANQTIHQPKQQIVKQPLPKPFIIPQAAVAPPSEHKIIQQPSAQTPVVIGKAPLMKVMSQQQIMTGAVASPPLIQHILATNAAGRIVQVGKTMDPPKVEVNIAGCVMVPRSNASPQNQPRHVLQPGLPVPAYEASLHGERNVFNRSRSPPPAHQNSPSPQGEGIAHFPPGSVPLRHELPGAHYMPAPHVMYQYLRQQNYHLPRSPIVAGSLEKAGDAGQEAEEAPATSPPLELRRPGSVGLALARPGSVPHSLQSPLDRATDSPQVGQVYNMHSARIQYPSTRYYNEPGDPPPAHRPLTSHSTLAALGSDRPLTHIGLGTPDRPLSTHSALVPHSLGIPERPLSTHLPDRSQHSGPIDRGLNAVFGASANILGTRHAIAEAPTSQRGLQAATPPHASQVPAQAESLLMLLKQYPLMWQGLLALKNDQAAVQMYFVSGNDSVAKMSLPKNTDGSTPPLRIFQRMRLEPPQVEGVARKMQMENEHCMLLALPCGHDHMDVLKQSTNLTYGFITYLQQKQAAGIVNVAAPGTTQPPAYVVHIFPSCDFVNENLRRIAPSLLERVADIAHLLIVITTV